MSTQTLGYLEMTVDYPGETEQKENVPVGSVVKYLGHVPGGMVQVEIIKCECIPGIPPRGSIRIMHPHCFNNLRGRGWATDAHEHSR